MPDNNITVPACGTARQGIAGATRQLDFVFASEDIGDRGDSDYDRVAIEVVQARDTRSTLICFFRGNSGQ